MGSYVLKYGQAFVQEKFNQDSSNLMIVGPMSYGKTVLGLACVLQRYQQGLPRDLLWTIVVPPKALRTWHDEVVKMYGPEICDSKSLDSPVIFVHSDISNVHNKLTALSAVSPQTHLVVMTNAKKKMDFDVPFGIVVDEAHTGKGWMAHTQAAKRSLLLTATDIGREYKVNLKTITISWDRASYVPKVKHTYCPIEGVTSETPVTSPLYLEALEYLLIQRPEERKVIYIPAMKDPSLGDAIIALCLRLNQSIFPYWSTATIKKFEKQKKSVLLITHQYSESININAEVCILFRPDLMNPVRIGQVMGRCCRTTNPNKEIEMYHLIYPGFPLCRVRYACACFDLEITAETELEKHGLLQAFRLLRLMDDSPTLDNTLPADVVAICNQTGPYGLTWWRDQRSNLSDEEKKRILCF
jgi:hypothetical protein